MKSSDTFRKSFSSKVHFSSSSWQISNQARETEIHDLSRIKEDRERESNIVDSCTPWYVLREFSFDRASKQISAEIREEFQVKYRLSASNLRIVCPCMVDNLSYMPFTVLLVTCVDVISFSLRTINPTGYAPHFALIESAPDRILYIRVTRSFHFYGAAQCPVTAFPITRSPGQDNAASTLSFHLEANWWWERRNGLGFSEFLAFRVLSPKVRESHLARGW